MLIRYSQITWVEQDQSILERSKIDLLSAPFVFPTECGTHQTCSSSFHYLLIEWWCRKPTRNFNTVSPAVLVSMKPQKSRGDVQARRWVQQTWPLHMRHQDRTYSCQSGHEREAFPNIYETSKTFLSATIHPYKLCRRNLVNLQVSQETSESISKISLLHVKKETGWWLVNRGSGKLRTLHTEKMSTMQTPGIIS